MAIDYSGFAFPKPAKQKPTKEDKDKRKAYLRLRGNKCEVCGSKSNVGVHHRIKQQKQYLEENSNYVALCWWGCHHLLNGSKKQFLRDIKISSKSRFKYFSKEELYNYLIGL